MPAIDLARLAHEVERLEALFTAPDELRRGTLDLLEFYAPRARRRADPAATSDPDRSFDVPPPVVRAIGLGLERQARRAPALALPAAEALWSASLREARVLACWMLPACEPTEAAAWLESHAGEMDDPLVLQAAVERGLAAWRRIDGRGYVDQVDRWVASPGTAYQALGLRALEAGLDLTELDDMQRAFEVLGRLPRPVRGEARHALESVLARLADRSPAETTRFLLEELERGAPGTEALARAVAARLPPAQRERLREARQGRPPSTKQG